MKRSSGLLALSAIAALSGGLFLGSAQGQIRDDGIDPSTPYGQSVIQNEHYQQQEQENERQSRQNQQQLQDQQRQQNDANPQWQRPGGYNRSYNQDSAAVSGVYGAIYVFPANPSISWITYNWRLPASARAAAKVGCYRSAGGKECILALDFHNACSAIAYGGNRVWAARAAGTVGAARAEAMAACHRAGGQSCVAVNGYCSPNNN